MTKINGTIGATSVRKLLNVMVSTCDPIRMFGRSPISVVPPMLENGISAKRNG